MFGSRPSLRDFRPVAVTVDDELPVTQQPVMPVEPKTDEDESDPKSSSSATDSVTQSEHASSETVVQTQTNGHTLVGENPASAERVTPQLNRLPLTPNGDNPQPVDPTGQTPV